MPIYEYICGDCGNKFEKLVRSSDNNEQECSKCESKNVKKTFSTFSACGSSSGAVHKGHSCGG